MSDPIEKQHLVSGPFQKTRELDEFYTWYDHLLLVSGYFV